MGRPCAPPAHESSAASLELNAQRLRSIRPLRRREPGALELRESAPIEIVEINRLDELPVAGVILIVLPALSKRGLELFRRLDSEGSKEKTRPRRRAQR